MTGEFQFHRGQQLNAAQEDAHDNRSRNCGRPFPRRPIGDGTQKQLQAGVTNQRQLIDERQREVAGKQMNGQTRGQQRESPARRAIEKLVRLPQGERQPHATDDAPLQ